MVLQILLKNYKPEFEDYYLALTIQLKLNCKSHFVKNIISNADRLLLYKDKRAWDLIETAYSESAIIRDEESQLKLSKILKSAGRFDKLKLEQYRTQLWCRNG